jgi:hypothetical protein
MNYLDCIDRRDLTGFKELWDGNPSIPIEIVISNISRRGYIEFLQYIYAYCKYTDTPFIYNSEAINEAAAFKHIDIIKWFESISSDVKFELNYKAVDNAATSGSIDILSLLLSYEKENRHGFLYSHMAIIGAVEQNNISVLFWFYDNRKFRFPDMEFADIIDTALVGHHHCLCWFNEYFPDKVQERISLSNIMDLDDDIIADDISDCYIKDIIDTLQFLISKGYYIPIYDIRSYFMDRFISIIALLSRNGYNIRNNVEKGSISDKWLNKHKL